MTVVFCFVFVVCPEHCWRCRHNSIGQIVCESNGCESRYAFKSTDGTCMGKSLLVTIIKKVTQIKA